MAMIVSSNYYVSVSSFSLIVSWMLLK